MGFIDPGYDLSIPRQWAGMNHLPQAVPRNTPVGAGEVRIHIREYHAPDRDAIVYDLQMGDLHRRLSIDGADMTVRRSEHAQIYIRRRLEEAAMQLQKHYFARWSSWPIEQLGVTWGLCHKCGQAANGHYAYGNGKWECPHGCP